MKASFKETPKSTTTEEVAPTSEVETPNPRTALVPREDRAPAVFVDDNDAQGEFDPSDIEKSFMSIVSKVGELSNLFTPGDFLVNKEFVIGGTKSPIELIAIGIRKRYQNDLPFGDEIGDEVDTAMEVLNRGGVLEYRPFDDKTSENYWKPILQVLFLVKKPANVAPDAASLFMFAIGGSDYAVIGYTARTKTAYNGIAKPLISLKKSKGTVRGRMWKLSSKGEDWTSPSGDARSWIQASLRSAGDTPAEVLQFLTENHG